MPAKVTEIEVNGEILKEPLHTSPGTIRIYRNDDSEGRRARFGGHTNYGYSGYYLASIYDGTKWRRLQFNRLISYENRSYEMARQCPQVENYLRSRIGSWQGMIAKYDSVTRSFRIVSLEMPE